MNENYLAMELTLPILAIEHFDGTAKPSTVVVGAFTPGSEHSWQGRSIHGRVGAIMTAVTNLAAYTQSATSGDPGKILSAGFDVCRPRTTAPAPDLAVVTGVTVALNETPGHSHLTWNAVEGADGYLVQGSADPADPANWGMPVIAMKARCEGNGAAPGKPYWYRVAAFNANGQGPWSAAAARPVM